MRELEDHYWWFVSRRLMAQEWLEEFCPDGKVLDLGCGTGALLQSLQETREAAGVDFSPLALEFCQSRGLKNLHEADAQALPLPDASFRAVITLDTLEHVPDDTKAMAEICRVLEPGGIVIINVPAFQWLWGPHDVALHHFRRYTPKMLKSRLEAAGFKVVRLSCGVFFFFPLVVAIRLAEKLKRREPEVKLPKVSPGLNRLLLKIMAFEAKLMTKIPLPWGSSVCAVAMRDPAKAPLALHKGESLRSKD